MKKFQDNLQIKNILYYSLGYENDAISTLRCFGPAKKLNKNILVGFQNGVTNINLVNDSDIVFVERDFPRKFDEFSKIRTLAKDRNIPLIYDIDDLLFELPKSHPDRISGFYSTALLPMLDAVISSDLVIVTNENLLNYFKYYNDNVKIFLNYLNDDIWSLEKNLETKSETPITIGYMGGHTHLPDLDSIKSVLLQILKKYEGKVLLKIIGLKPPEELRNHAQVDWTIPNLWKYSDFATYFQNIKVDIFIAPLLENNFNSYKSAIKYLEYGSLRRPGIFSNVEPYKNLIINNQNGFLASSLDEWENYLSILIENEPERRRIASNVISDIKKNWLLSDNISQWNELLFLAYDNKKKYKKKENHYLNQIVNINNQTYPKVKLLESENYKKEKTIIGKDRIINQLNSELVSIKSSRTWLLAQFFHKIFNKLFPFESKRLKFVKRTYHNFKYWKNYSKIVITKRNKKSSPLISVVIPIFDRTDLLIESIESILKQSYKNFELILVCDGSPKETIKIVQNYTSNYKNVRAFYFKNNSGNAVRGRNKGIIEAKGKFLAFQDSDDIAEPDRLITSLSFLTSYDVDVVYSGWRVLNDGSRKIDLKNGEEIFSPECTIDLLKTTCVPCQSTVMAKVSALKEVGGFNEKMKYREDHEMWLRLAYLGYKFKAIDKVLSTIRLHENNLELHYKSLDDKWFSLMHEEYKKHRNMKPKIGYIIPGTGISGGIAVICEHTNRLLNRGYDVTMLSEDNKKEITWYPNQSVEVIPISDVSDNYNILIATGWTTAFYLKKLKSDRKIYFVQSDERRFFDKGDQNIKKVNDTYKMDFEFITEAVWIRNWLKEEFNKDALLVPNGLNTEIFHKVEPLEPKKSKLRVLLEGPISIPFKGMKEAFEAVKDIDCEVWCVSSAGVPKPEWKCERFFKGVPINKMKYIYSSCDVLLKMSKVEGFFGPPLEMMACGGAVVVGKVTGYDEYITNGYNALVVEEGDVNGARNAIKTLQENRELLSNLIRNGKKTVNNWNWENSIDILENFLKK